MLGAVQSSLPSYLNSAGVLFYNVFELFCNFVSYRKLITMQIIQSIDVPKNFVQWRYNWVQWPYFPRNQLNIYEQIHLVIPQCLYYLFFGVSFELFFNTLLVPSLLNELSKIFNMC